MNVVDLPQTSGMTKALGQLKTNIPQLIEYQVILAELRRNSYTVHIEQGLTAEESLELCKTVLAT